MQKSLVRKGLVLGIIISLIGSGILTIAPVIKADLTDGLIGYWSLDDGSGSTAYDSSGNGNDDDSVKEKVVDNTICTGSIEGDVIRYYGGGWQDPIPFAKIDIGIKTTFANRFAHYNLNFLPIDRTYSVTASAIGYQSETREVTLTSEKPHVIQHFYLKETDEDKAVKQRVILNNDNGRIYGHTVSSFAWSWNPISNVLVTTGLQGKSTVSDGYYSISGLPLNIPIRVTARKFGYYSDSKTVTLTNDDSEEYLILDLQPFLAWFNFDWNPAQTPYKIPRVAI